MSDNSEYKTYEQALKDGEKRGLQKHLEKAIVLSNGQFRWAANPEREGKIGIQLAEILSPEDLGGQALVLVQEIDEGGKSGMYPLAIILDPQRMSSIQPTLSNEQYDALNDLIESVVNVEVDTDKGKAHLADIELLSDMTSVEALKGVEAVAEFLSMETSHNKLAANLERKMLSDGEMEDETEEKEDE